MAAPAPRIDAEHKTTEASAAPRAPRGSEYWVEAVDDRARWHEHEAAWRALAENAVEPNAFYEPWLFLPGARHFEPETTLRCFFVYRGSPRPSEQPTLCGVFPFERRRWFRGMPVRTLRLWEPAFVLSTPLIHRDCAREVLRQLFDWVVAEERCALIEMPMVHAEGPFHQALVDVLNERRMLSFVDEVFTRALIRRGNDAASYCAGAMDKETLRN